MEASRILARIIGPLLIVLAVGVFLNMEFYRSLATEFSKSASLRYLGGFIALLLGLIMLQLHNKWEARWPVVITILGWITAIKGALLILFPGLIAGLWSPYAAAPVVLTISLAISCAIGVFLTIKGYWG